MYTCTMFATYTNWLSRELETVDPDLLNGEKPANMTTRQWQQFQSDRERRNRHSTDSTPSEGTPETRLDRISELLQKYEYNFSRHLQILLDSLNHYAATETVVLLGLCARLSTANQGTRFTGLQRNEEEGNGAAS